MIAKSINYVVKPGSLLAYNTLPQYLDPNEEELRWLRQSFGNTYWVLAYGVRLYRRLSGKASDEYRNFFSEASRILSENHQLYTIRQQTPFLNQAYSSKRAFLGNFLKEPNVHTAYKLWMINRWNHQKTTPTWANAGLKPDWYNPVI